jgi:hypothetical protein
VIAGPRHLSKHARRGGYILDFNQNGSEQVPHDSAPRSISSPTLLKQKDLLPHNESRFCCGALLET